MIRADSTKTLPLKDCSVDAIVTDPPYGLEFMGKKWDRLWDKRNGKLTDLGIQKQGDPFIGKNLSQYRAGLEAQLWHAQWLAEAYRVLKPGGSMLVMGGTRTFHRLMCAVEDTGFIIKDTLMWVYGSGFPKAQEVSVLVDAKILGISTKEVNRRRKKIAKNPNDRKKRENNLADYGLQGGVGDGFITQPLTPEGEYWDGFKVGGIKPAYEPIVWAVKPPEGSYVDNVLKWNVGAVNVEETRINGQPHHNEAGRPSGEKSFTGKGGSTHTPASGRFPANIILGHHPECVQVGMKRVKGNARPNQSESIRKIKNGVTYPPFDKRIPCKLGDSDGYEIVESWRCHPDCAVRMLDEQSGNLQSGKGNVRRKEGFFVEHGGLGKAGDVQVSYGDSGGASRFFKQCNYGQEEWLCHKECALRLLDEQSVQRGVHSAGSKRAVGTAVQENPQSIFYDNKGSPNNGIRFGDSGGASRFYYCAKASRSERNAGLEGMEENKDRLFKDRKLIVCNICGCKAMKEAPGKQLRCEHNDYRYETVKHETSYKNNHPTVKPIKLFEWLIKLVTREGQTVLDPFLGSGTTAIAAHNTGRKCIGIEREEEYLGIARGRIAHWRGQPGQPEQLELQ